MESSSRSLKRSLLKNMIAGLQVESFASAVAKNTGLVERKRAIKLSADIATAVTRGMGANWSRAVMADLSRQEESKILISSFIGRNYYQRMLMMGNNGKKNKNITCKMILKRVHQRMRKRTGCLRWKANRTPASHIVKEFVKKKTGFLKSLIPGGERLNSYQSLLVEALDYVVYLRSQVDSMRRIAIAMDLISNASSCTTGNGSSDTINSHESFPKQSF